MASASTPFFFLLLLPGLSSQLQLQESGPGVVRPGGTLELTCTVTGSSVTSSYWWSWVRQTPGKGLDWMGGWAGNTYYAPAFSGRITISVDPSQTKYFLRLTSVTAADSAMYYCASDTERSHHYFEFGGTLELTCTVTGASVTSSYYWNWVRQAPGKGLVWMGYWTGWTSYAPAFRDRITISVDPSQTKYFLRLTSVTAADSAMYYCASDTDFHPSSSSRNLGQGWRDPRADLYRHWSLSYKQLLVELGPPGSRERAGLSSQLQLQESGSEVVRPGGTVELTCTVTGGSITSSYNWHWVHQNPGKGLVWMGLWTGGRVYSAPAFSGRITISVNPSQAKYFLRLTSVTAADSAMYYCARQPTVG
ncbi:uncharacterized protein LOC129339977 [Eublepharis macularius]|uniref:Uncharacterized protein LOC129339977 n=1 Tax=Eublepharis macularius TaxID=481883 RepID=A0AA97K7T4_EUBMA|nr:uncharacterized protein LOC129339977 [Eublepharis macularius]